MELRKQFGRTYPQIFGNNPRQILDCRSVALTLPQLLASSQHLVLSPSSPASKILHQNELRLRVDSLDRQIFYLILSPNLLALLQVLLVISLESHPCVGIHDMPKL